VQPGVRPRGTGNGDVYVSPTLGVFYNVNENFKIFSDVTYSWNVFKNFNRSGGEVTMGIDYILNDSIVITPSVFKLLDSNDNSSNLRLEVSLKF
jgi:hypothetical protein